MLNISRPEGAARNGVSFNTSLNRQGEPVVYSPTGALTILYGSDLQFLMMQNVLDKSPMRRNLKSRIYTKCLNAL